MGRLVSYMFTSLDGFIADRDGGLDWVPIDDELMAFANGYFGEAAGIVFGRAVHGGFVDYWDALDVATATPLEAEFASIFGAMRRVVASTTLESADPRTTVIRGDVAAAVAAAKGASERDLLLVCGPALRATLIDGGILDRLRVLVVPAVLGDGVPLVGATRTPVALRLDATRRFGNGVLLLDYAVV